MRIEVLDFKIIMLIGQNLSTCTDILFIDAIGISCQP